MLCNISNKWDQNTSGCWRCQLRLESPSSEIWYIKSLCGFVLNGLPSQTCAQHVIKHLQWIYSKLPGSLLQPILTNLGRSLRVLRPPFLFICVTAPASRGWRDPGRCTGCWWLLWRWYSQMDAKPCAGFSWWSPSCQRPHLHGDACHPCTPSGSAVRPGACYSLAKPPALRLDPSPCQTSWRSCCRRQSWWRWRQTERMGMTDGAEWSSASKTHSSCVSRLNASYALTCRSCSKRTRTCQRCSRFHRENTAYSLNIHEPVGQSDSQSFFCRTSEHAHYLWRCDNLEVSDLRNYCFK